MYKHCTTEDSVRRQRQFEHCLLELMRTCPYNQITIGDICLRMELSRKSFYRYFSSKEDCLHALIDHSIMDFIPNHLPDDSGKGDHNVLEYYFRYWKTLSPLLDALYRNGLVNCLFERTLVCVTEDRHEFQKLLHTNSPDATDEIIFIISGITGVLLNWHITGYQKSPRQLAAALEKLMPRSN